MDTENIAHCINIEFNRNEQQITIIIKPFLQYYQYSRKFYLYFLLQFFLIISNIVIAILASTYSYIYGILYLVLYVSVFISDREFTQLFLGLQFMSLIALVFASVEYLNIWYLLSLVLCLAENLFIGSLKNKLFKEIICITVIKINPTSILVERKLGNWWQKDYSVEDLAVRMSRKAVVFHINKMMAMNMHFFTYQLHMLITNMGKPSVYRNNKFKEIESKQFQFGFWLSYKQKNKLVKEVRSYLYQVE